MTLDNQAGTEVVLNPTLSGPEPTSKIFGWVFHDTELQCLL